jgi:hypothetical protein
MRRTVFVATIFLLGLALAAPALAQTRDPFEPQEGEAQEQSPDGGDPSGQDPFEPETGDRSAQEAPDAPTLEPTTDPVPVEDPEPQSPTVQSGTLSNTGADVSLWSGVGYLLIIVGAAALVLAWMFAPRLSQRRR